MDQLIKFIEPLLDRRCNFIIYKEGNTPCIDLNTMAKSECILKKENEALYAYRRYNKIDRISTLGDLIDIVYECHCGRSYFNTMWTSIFEEYGLGDNYES